MQLTTTSSASLTRMNILSSSSPLQHNVHQSLSFLGTFGSHAPFVRHTAASAFPLLLAAASDSSSSDFSSSSSDDKLEDYINSIIDDSSNNNANSTATTTSIGNKGMPESTSSETAGTAAAAAAAFPQTQQQTPKTKIMDNIKLLVDSPRPRAVLFMSIAMALHFGGYEFVRSGMLALFTSKDVGFSHSGAIPLAMSCASPASFVLLMGYGRILEKRGPKVALRHTTLFSLLVFAVTSLVLKLATGFHLATQIIVALAFVYTNSYAHLLYTQHWSFLSSVMTPDEGSIWFASIAGISSIVCTMTGTMVKPLVNSVGLLGIIFLNSQFLLASLFLSDRAYQLSETHGFDPTKTSKQKPKPTTSDNNNNNNKQDKSTTSLLWKAKDLFQRVPTLGALFGEVLSFQSLSVILNIAMVTQLKISVPSDADRAAWTGRFFALVSGVSGLLQFVVMPLFMKRIEPQVVWRIMPIIPLMCSLFQSFQGSNPALSILALSFFAAKTMDYSVRGVCNEMVYQPLDFDSRYLGKEIIGVFGSRFGKSGVSVILSCLSYVFPNFGIYHLSKLSVVASLSWLSSTWWLSRLVPKKAEAQAAFLEQRSDNQESKDKEKEE